MNNYGHREPSTLTCSNGSFGDQMAHRIYNNSRGAAVDPTAERYEVSLSSRSSEVIPEPARRSKSVKRRSLTAIYSE